MNHSEIKKNLPLIVWVSGLPGSGKSYFCNKLNRELMSRESLAKLKGSYFDIGMIKSDEMIQSEKTTFEKVLLDLITPLTDIVILSGAEDPFTLDYIEENTEARHMRIWIETSEEKRLKQFYSKPLREIEDFETVTKRAYRSGIYEIKVRSHFMTDSDDMIAVDIISTFLEGV